MKYSIEKILDGKSDFPYQALIIVEGARPFEPLSGRVLEWPHNQNRGMDRILLGSESSQGLFSKIGEIKIRLRTYASVSGNELENPIERTGDQFEFPDLEDQKPEPEPEPDIISPEEENEYPDEEDLEPIA